MGKWHGMWGAVATTSAGWDSDAVATVRKASLWCCLVVCTWYMVRLRHMLVGGTAARRQRARMNVAFLAGLGIFRW